MEPTQEKTAMENYEKLIAEIDEVVKQIKGLYDLAYTQYSHAVEEVIRPPYRRKTDRAYSRRYH